MKELSINDVDIKNIYKIIGANVKKARKAQNVSQLKLAIAIGHQAVGTVSMAELCINNKHFNIEHLVKIADVLEVPISDFFSGVELSKLD